VTAPRARLQAAALRLAADRVDRGETLAPEAAATLVGSCRNALPHWLVVALLSSVACSRQALSASPDAASGPRELALRVPAALMIARAIDSLSVSVDPATLASTQVAADVGMVIGVEREVFVFPKGQARPASGRSNVAPSADFTVSTDTWTPMHDGIPVLGTRYAVEGRFVLFETDVAVANGWNPHAGNYKALWSRTFQQAEE
jgi:hypothetical protein